MFKQIERNKLKHSDTVIVNNLKLFPKVTFSLNHTSTVKLHFTTVRGVHLEASFQSVNSNSVAITLLIK